jgi:hypothetical protein
VHIFQVNFPKNVSGPFLSGAAQKILDLAEQAFEIDRLGIVVISTGLLPQ